MQKKQTIATWLGALLGLLMALALNAGLAHGSDRDWVTEEFHKTYPLAANGRVELDNINGAVHISAWDQNQIKVDAIKTAEDERDLKEAEIRIDAHQDSISISTHYPQHEERWNRGNHSSASVEYTLTVPRNARLDEVKLINGALDVTGVQGEVRASCINGKLVARGLANETRLQTINGPLDALFDRLPASTIQLKSVNGPVELTLPSDAKASIEASTVHGPIDNDFGLRTNHHFVGRDMRGELGGGGAKITLNNVNGPIEIRHAKDGRALSPAKNAGNEKDDEI